MSLLKEWTEFLSTNCDFGDQKDVVERYAQAFAENEVKLTQTEDLDHALLKELGIKAVGHRLQILKPLTASTKSTKSGKETKTRRGRSKTETSTKTRKKGDRSRRTQNESDYQEPPQDPAMRRPRHYNTTDITQSSEGNSGDLNVSRSLNDPSPPRAVAAETGNATAGRRRVVDVNDYDHLPHQGMPSAAAVHANTNTDDYDQAPPAVTTAASSTKGSKGKANNDVISSDDEDDDDDDDDDYDYDDYQDADGRRTSSTPRRKSKKSAAESLEEEELAQLASNFRKDFGAYEIGSHEIETFEMIGRGGYAVVYRGRCRGEEVAVKILQSKDLRDDTRREFMAEVKIMSTLYHPNIVLFMGACSEPGKLVMVTQYLRGGSLLQIIENKAVEITLLHALSMARDT